MARHVLKPEEKKGSRNWNPAPGREVDILLDMILHNAVFHETYLKRLQPIIRKQKKRIKHGQDLITAHRQMKRYLNELVISAARLIASNGNFDWEQAFPLRYRQSAIVLLEEKIMSDYRW